VGRIKSTNIKKAAVELYRKHPDKFQENFESNKQELKGILEVESKQVRNKIAGYLCKLTKKGTKNSR
jgi:small subunit ribosomal protein S17e